MIFDQIVSVLAGFLQFIAGLLDFPDVPTEVTNIPTYVGNVSGWMAGTGAWVPWSLTMTMVVLWAACVAAALVIRIVRIVASFLTAGGGGAA